MKAIWKFSLGDGFRKVIEMPAGAKILSVQEHFRQGVFWALVDTDQPNEKRVFQSVLTGNTYPENGTYLGTYQVDAGNYVVHVFEVKS